MAKDYNIDDILSEVKQRRAEQESNLKAAPAPKAAPVQTDANREAYAGKLVEELLGPEKPAVKPEPKEKKTAPPAAITGILTDLTISGSISLIDCWVPK